MSSRLIGGSRDDATKIGGEEDGCRTQTRVRERENGEAGGVSFFGFGFEQSLSLADLLVLSNRINVYKKRRYSTWGDKQPLSSIACSSSTLAAKPPSLGIRLYFEHSFFAEENRCNGERE